MNDQRIAELKEYVRRARLETARLIHRAGSGHIGGDFSEAELITALYHEILNVSPADFARAPEGEPPLALTMPEKRLIPTGIGFSSARGTPWKCCW